MRKALLGFFIFLSVLTLASCGFHLRGEVPLAEPLQNLYIKSREPYSQFNLLLKQSLSLSGVHFTATESEASAVLVILNEVQGEQLLGVGSTQQTRQYNLTLTVTFEITDPQGSIIVPPQSLSETRIIAIQANQILGGSNEESNLYQQMRGTIVYSLMMRLGSKNMNNALAGLNHTRTQQ